MSKVACPVCGGIGVVEAAAVQDIDTGQYDSDELDCPFCDGTGKVEDSRTDVLLDDPREWLLSWLDEERDARKVDAYETACAMQDWFDQDDADYGW